MTTHAIPKMTAALSDAARARLEHAEGGPILLSDWTQAVFIHYRIDAGLLQPHVPFNLDLRDGHAYISLVMFRFERCRVCVGERVSNFAAVPVSGHAFINLRTYVTHHGEPGIYFLGEWLNNPITAALGPKTFGLPCRWSSIHAQHRLDDGRLSATVHTVLGQGTFTFNASFDPDATPAPAEPQSLDEFLVERYTAYTRERTTLRRFRVWHRPWNLLPLQHEVTDSSLFTQHTPHAAWFKDAQPAGASYSPGVHDIWIGRPTCINGPACGVGWPVKK